MKTQLLDNLSEQNHKIMLSITLKLCTSDNTQNEILNNS